MVGQFVYFECVANAIIIELTQSQLLLVTGVSKFLCGQFRLGCLIASKMLGCDVEIAFHQEFPMGFHRGAGVFPTPNFIMVSVLSLSSTTQSHGERECVLQDHQELELNAVCAIWDQYELLPGKKVAPLLLA